MAESASDRTTVGAAGRDERLTGQSRLRRFLGRPEFGAFFGLALVFIFFALTARGTGMFAGVAFENLVLKPGEVKDLGDIRSKPPVDVRGKEAHNRRAARRVVVL